MVAPTWPIFKQTIMCGIRHLAPRLGLSRPGSDELLDFVRRRVEETLDLLGLADLRDRALATLSGGQRQRVAIGAVIIAAAAADRLRSR